MDSFELNSHVASCDKYIVTKTLHLSSIYGSRIIRAYQYFQNHDVQLYPAQ